MYRPGPFDMPGRDDCHALMRAESFGLLISTGADFMPVATHLPLWLDADEGEHGTLYGHVARANPQWRLFDGVRPALALFWGAHAYVSPRWYKTAHLVPTWNYVTVHAGGRPQALDGDDDKLAVLRRLTDSYEQGKWSVDGLPANVLAGNLKGIVAFRLPIDRLEGKAKLSQNRGGEDIDGIIAGLEGEAAGDPLALVTAGLMRARR
jgi:transcriptional regulator